MSAEQPLFTQYIIQICGHGIVTNPETFVIHRTAITLQSCGCDVTQNSDEFVFIR